MKKIVAVLMGTLVLGISGLAFAADPAPAAAPAKPAAAVVGVVDLENAKLTDIASKEITAKSVLAGKTTVVAFAQTACSNCRDEISYLVAIQKDYPKVQFAVAFVDMRPSEPKIASYVQELGFTGVVFTDPQFRFAKMVGVNNTPSLVVINKDGKVTFTQAGYDDGAKTNITAALK